MKRLLIILVSALMCAALSGCVHRGPILVEFGYEQAAGRTPFETPRVVVALSRFKDDRGKVPSVAGRKFNSLNDEVNDLVVQGTVADKVETALRHALRARDITVRDGFVWDLTEADIPASDADLVLGGEVKTLWVESLSAFANTKVKAVVELRIVAADPHAKQIVRALKVDSRIERQDVSYSTALVEESMSEALSAAVNQIFVDAELKNRLK